VPTAGRPRIDWIFGQSFDELTDPSAPRSVWVIADRTDGPFAPPVIGSRHRPTESGEVDTMPDEPRLREQARAASWAATAKQGNDRTWGGPGSASSVRYAISL